jgi:hypothetical protein
LDVLVRELREGQGGITASRDTELSTSRVTIGCAPDQEIQLFGRAVGARHAVIRGGREPVLTCLGRQRVMINDKWVRRARLKIGTCIEVGGHRLTLTQPPTGFDLAIELRPNPQIDASDLEAAFRTDLAQTWLARRGSMWLLVALVVLLGFGVPLLVARGGSAKGPLAAWARTRLHASSVWSSGPLAPGHQQLMGDDCTPCHQTFFVAVADPSCRTCHARVRDHVDPKVLAQTSLGPPERCAACHREHEPGYLVDRSDRGCKSCHADAPRTFGTIKVEAVTGFGAGRHPAFLARPRVQEIAKAGSGLKFSHAQHLNGNQVRKIDGRLLGCADCHRLSTDGYHFEVPTMADHCIGCHELAFDPDAPDRQLPHGKPREVVRVLEDYFVRKLSEPGGGHAPARERRRLPGREEDEDETECKGSTYQCAMKLAKREVEVEFQRRGCVSCHQVKDTRSTDLIERFQVQPVTLRRAFFAAARFPHRSHLIQNGVGGDEACLTCHPARSVEAGNPLAMLPEINTCERCHSDLAVRDRTRVSCVSCHAYHRT